MPSVWQDCKPSVAQCTLAVPVQSRASRSRCTQYDMSRIPGPCAPHHPKDGGTLLRMHPLVYESQRHQAVWKQRNLDNDNSRTGRPSLTSRLVSRTGHPTVALARPWRFGERQARTEREWWERWVSRRESVCACVRKWISRGEAPQDRLPMPHPCSPSPCHPGVGQPMPWDTCITHGQPARMPSHVGQGSKDPAKTVEL